MSSIQLFFDIMAGALGGRLGQSWEGNKILVPQLEWNETAKDVVRNRQDRVRGSLCLARATTGSG